MYIDIRCNNCNKKLLEIHKYTNNDSKIKCPRCKTKLNVLLKNNKVLLKEIKNQM